MPNHASLRAIPITDAAEAASVVEKFRKKYGANAIAEFKPVTYYEGLPDRLHEAAILFG